MNQHVEFRGERSLIPVPLRIRVVIAGADAAKEIRLGEPRASRVVGVDAAQVEDEAGRGGSRQEALIGAGDRGIEVESGPFSAAPPEFPSRRQSAAFVAEGHDDHVVAEGSAKERPLEARPVGNVAVVSPQHHPAIGTDPPAEPLRVFGHGLVTPLFTGHQEMALDGDAQALERHLEGVLSSRHDVLVPVSEETLPDVFQRQRAFRPVRIGLIPVRRARKPAVRAVGEVLEAPEFCGDLLQSSRIHLAHVLAHVVERHPRELHVEAVESHVTARLVVVPHPLDHLEHGLGVPGPEIESRQEDFRVPHPGADVAVDTARLRPTGLDRKGVEAHFFDEEAEDPRLHLEEVAGAVGPFAEGHDACVSHDVAEEIEVRVGKREVGAVEGVDVRVEPDRHRVRGEGP